MSSVGEYEEFLNMDGDDGCTTIRIYQMPLNCTLKMVKMVNFVTYILPRFFKKLSHKFTLCGTRASSCTCPSLRACEMAGAKQWQATIVNQSELDRSEILAHVLKPTSVHETSAPS